MTEESSTLAEICNSTTAVEATTVDASTLTSSSLRGIEFYFYWAVVVIGAIGTSANALILYALVASKEHKKHVLIVNQNALDLFSCIFLVVTYSVKLGNVRLSDGWLGYWLCMLIHSDNILWAGINGSIINLAIIAIERYLKIVHAAWSKTKLRNWMIYSAMAFAWVGSIIYANILVFLTCAVINGVCYVMIFNSKASKLSWFFWKFVSFYVIILSICVFCYARILLVVRRQAKIMAGHHAADAASNAAQNPRNQLQSNIIKTMILVCGFYAVMWLPSNVSHLIMALSPVPNPFLISGYYATLFLAFLYTCSNPFIYATKFNPVKEILLRIIPCRKTSNQAMQSGNNS